MKNMHICMNSFRYQSRVLKETESLLEEGIVDSVLIVALHEGDLPIYEQLGPGRELIRLKLITRGWPKQILFQAFKYLEFTIRVLVLAKRSRVALVNVHLLALLPIGVLLKRFFVTSLVYDAHELETETYGLTGMRKRLAKWLERRLIGQVDLTIVVGEAIEKWYRKTYRSAAARIVTVMNSPRYCAPLRSDRLRDELGIDSNKKILIYQGGLIAGRGIEQLLKVYASLDKKTCPYVMVFMGYGELESSIEHVSRTNPLVFLQSAVAPSVVLEYTASADLGISYIDNLSLNDRYCLPNKLFESIMARVPVIVNNQPEMSRLVNGSEIGLVLEELTPSTLLAAFDQIESIGPDRIAKNLNSLAIACSWENQAKIMSDAYDRWVWPLSCRLA